MNGKEIEYVFMESDPGDLIECDSCSYKAPLHKFKVLPRGIRLSVVQKSLEEETRLYCELCAGSFASNASHYPEHYPDRNAMATVCHVGNAILQQLGAWLAVPTEALPDEALPEPDYR